ncbi:MAG TPA: hypothetical protein VEX18_11785, partial [Polyangiaceae bacterium]|nr:hypothetical protein [Polyangiaceae bacterium]
TPAGVAGGDDAGGKDAEGSEGGAKSMGTAGSEGAGEGPADAAGAAGAAGAPLEPTCMYTEQHDTTNMRAVPIETGFAEDTQLVLADGELVFCGTIDPGHFASNSDTVDVDSFSIDVTGATEILVKAEFAEPSPSGSLHIAATPAGGTDRRTTAASGRAALWRPVSTQLINVSAVMRATAALAEPIPYVIRVRADDVEARCPKLAAGDATATYAESNDGDGTKNDTVEVGAVVGEQAPTADATDAPEPTGIALDLGTKVLISGSSASVGSNIGYRDIDTFALNPGSASLLTFRIDWAGEVDFDLYLFHANDYKERGTTFENVNPDMLSLAADASSTWWLLAGLGSVNTSQLPKAYTISICNEAF